MFAHWHPLKQGPSRDGELKPSAPLEQVKGLKEVGFANPSKFGRTPWLAPVVGAVKPILLQATHAFGTAGVLQRMIYRCWSCIRLENIATESFCMDCQHAFAQTKDLPGAQMQICACSWSMVIPPGAWLALRQSACMQLHLCLALHY